MTMYVIRNKLAQCSVYAWSISCSAAVRSGDEEIKLAIIYSENNLLNILSFLQCQIFKTAVTFKLNDLRSLNLIIFVPA